MKAVNHIQLIGHLGQDPIIKNFENGVKVANFSIATNEKFTNKAGEPVEKTYWHNVSAWGKLAEIVSQKKKGNKILITGKLTYNDFEKDGQKIKTAEIIADEIYFL